MRILEVLAADFPSAETNGQPVIIRGGCKQWPAYRKWRGKDGLQYLSDLCGDATVEVMCSQDRSFQGNISGRKIESCTFREFLADASESEQLYLAQNPICSSKGHPGPLHALQADIITPAFLEKRELSSLNLWMSMRGSSSSLHYDPYQNLLCIVGGSKAVKIFSPAATPFLYPLPLWGESSNHSAVNVVKPNLEEHPSYTRAKDHMGTDNLQAGDMLFLPEGFWHQVDSTPGTIAVNFWWQSATAHLLDGPPNQYLLRRLLQSAVQAKKEELLAEIKPFYLKYSIQGLPPYNDCFTLVEILYFGIRALARCPSLDRCGCSKHDQSESAAAQPAKRARKNTPAERPSTPASKFGNTSFEVGGARMWKLAALDAQHRTLREKISRLIKGDQPTVDWNPPPHAIYAYELSMCESWERYSAGPLYDRDQLAKACGRCWERIELEHASVISSYQPLIWTALHLTYETKGFRGTADDDELGIKDKASQVLAALTAEQVTHLMLFLVRHAPHIVEKTLLGKIAPCAAELLTRHFEEADARCKDARDQKARQDFYTQLYSVVKDKAAVMQKLVELKEKVAKEAANRVKNEQWAGGLSDTVKME